MLFAKVGDTISHPKHGSGTVTKLLGVNKDDAVRVKLKNGKSMKIDLSDGKGEWKIKKKSKVKESTPAQLVDRLLEDEHENFLKDEQDAGRESPLNPENLARKLANDFGDFADGELPSVAALKEWIKEFSDELRRLAEDRPNLQEWGPDEIDALIEWAKTSDA
jgi:hypothetical protein